MPKRKCISLECKRLIIRDVEKGVLKKSEIAKKHGILPCSLSTILKNKAIILENAEKEQYSKKRIRKCLYEDVDEAMLKWTQAMHARNLPLSGPLIRKKAKEFATLLGHVQFGASVGWLDKFKKRHGILEKTISGESLWASYSAVENVETLLEDCEDGACTMDIPSDEDILQSVVKISGATDSYEHAADIAQAAKEVQSCQNASSLILGLRSFIETRKNVPNKVFKSLIELELFIDKEKWKNK